MSLDLEKKLGKLAQIKPTKQFKNTLREELMEKAGAQRVYKASAFNFGNIFRVRIFKHAYATVAIGVFIFLGGSGVLAMKAANSLPGDFLYNVKRAGEKAQVGLTLSQASKVNKEVDIAGKRIEELAKLTIVGVEDAGTRDGDEGGSNSDDIEKAVYDFHKEITSVKSRLDNLDKSGDKKVVEAAKAVDEKTEEFANALSEVVDKEDLPEPIRDKIIDSLTILDEIGSQTLGLRVKDYKEAEGEDAKTLVQRLEEKIIVTKAKIADIEFAAGQSLVEDEQGMLLSLEKKIELAKIILAEARGSLDNDDLAMTLQKVEESEDLAEEVGEELALAEEENVDDEDVPVDGEEDDGTDLDEDTDTGDEPVDGEEDNDEVICEINNEEEGVEDGVCVNDETDQTDLDTGQGELDDEEEEEDGRAKLDDGGDINAGLINAD